MTASYRCGWCRAELPSGVDFCPKCGTSVGPIAPANAAVRPASALSAEPIQATTAATGVILLIVLALLFASGAVVSVNQATIGVGLAAFACLAAILARIAQAGQQHRAEMQALEQLRRSIMRALAPQPATLGDVIPASNAVK